MFRVEALTKGGDIKVVVDEKPYRVNRTQGGMYVSQWQYRISDQYFVFVDVVPVVDDNLTDHSFYWRTQTLKVTGGNSYGRKEYIAKGDATFFDSLSEALNYACRTVRDADVTELERIRTAKKAYREGL